tara:strand:+ start:17251 stop:19530 length:2280 start_codon:yes stop_codon:yes gene_type:complete
MSRSRGKVKSFQPSNVKGIDTRIWQSKGSATDIDGVVFSLRGEVVKIGGMSRFVLWEPNKNGLRRSPFAKVLSPLPGVADGKDSRILTLGTFNSAGTTELMIAYYTPAPGIAAPGNSPGEINIAVLEHNKIRVVHSYQVAYGDPQPRYYPRFVDVGPFVIILVEGMEPVKWDGRITSPVGIREAPSPVTAVLVLGNGDNGGPIDNGGTIESLKPTLNGDFWEDHSFNDVDAAVRKITYYQTYTNQYGQESNLSPVSNELILTELLGVGIDPTHEEGMVSPEAARAARDEGLAVNSNRIYGTFRDVQLKARRLVSFLGLGSAPKQVDIAYRSLYRSEGSAPPTALPRKLGPAATSHFDIRKIGESAVHLAPVAGENNPPPPARWAFPFRGRVYYLGGGSVLKYSKVNFPEAVSVSNFIEVNTADGDEITAWGVAQDYAIVFKRRSAYLLTHDKAEDPVLTPLQSTFGAVSDRTVVSFDNNTYFMSDVGFHLFDGSSFKRISSALDDAVQLLPKHTRDAATVFADRQNNRVYISVNGNPGVENNQVWAIHADTGAFTVIKDRKVTAATMLKDEVIVGSVNNWGEPDLLMWDTAYTRDGRGFLGSFSTEWIELDNPHSDKRFYKLLLYFVQTGNIQLTVDWYTDWDNRVAAGSTVLMLKDEDTTYWGSGTWGTGLWDERRLVSKFVDLAEVGSGGGAQDINAKAIRFTFRAGVLNNKTLIGGGASKAAGTFDEDAPSPFRLVGWQLVGDDYGERAEGTAPRD